MAEQPIEKLGEAVSLKRIAGELMTGPKAAEIAGVFIEAFKAIYPHEVKDTEESRKGWKDWIFESAQKPDNLWIVVEDDELNSVRGILNGCGGKEVCHDLRRLPKDKLLDEAGIPIDPEKVFYVDTLAISPDFQGKGFGKKLLDATSEFVETHPQYEYVFLRTDEFLGSTEKRPNPAVKFYEKNGFKNLGASEQGKEGKVYFIKRILKSEVIIEGFSGKVDSVIAP